MRALGLFAGLAALLLLLYRAALNGPFVSDDPIYYLYNPYTQSLSFENLGALLDPGSRAHLYAYNYAPLHLLAVAVERQVFGDWMPGYHAVNLLLHALSALLLMALLRASRLPAPAAIAGGLLFAVHPANVEAVAWISQLKSTGALALGLGALLIVERRPLASTLLFGLALLTKFSAAAFLPMAAALAWSRRAPPARWAWLAAWTGVLAAVSLAQLAAFGGGGASEASPYADAGEQLRSMAAIGARYLWMAASGLGLSTYHEPEPVRAWLDAWCLAGLTAGALLTLRTLSQLRRQSEEAAWWIGAAAAFLPVSQLVPFRFPMADRYLYFMLPGLIGGVWLLAHSGWQRLEGRGAAGRWGPRLALAGVASLALLFAWQSAARTPLWNAGRRLMRDAARHYPQGSHGFYLRAVRAARRGDAGGAVAELRGAEERTRLSRVTDFARDPLLAGIHDAPLFREFVEETARQRLELARRRGPRPGERVVLALNHARLGEYDAAIELVEEALRDDPSQRQELLQILEQLRASRRRARDAATSPDLD